MGLTNLRDKLMRVEWTINIYDKDDKLIKKIDIEVPPMEQLRKIVPPNDGDPDLVDGYDLNAKQLAELNNYLTEKIVPEFELYSYCLVCGGIYDWDKPSHPNSA